MEKISLKWVKWIQGFDDRVEPRTRHHDKPFMQNHEETWNIQQWEVLFSDDEYQQSTSPQRDRYFIINILDV